MTAPAVVQQGPPAAYRPQSATLVSGQSVTVQTDEEARYFRASRDAYLQQTRFTDNTDLQDLDRLLMLELLVFRSQQFLFADADYLGDEIDSKALHANVRALSAEITKVKESMGLTKKARDDAANEGSVAALWAQLRQRGKIFGIHREKQLDRALTLMDQLSTVITTYDRSDAEEREKFGFESEAEILEWIRNRMLPEYRELDDYFREHVQRLWIRPA